VSDLFYYHLLIPLTQTFCRIFVIDRCALYILFHVSTNHLVSRSSSMWWGDRKPLPNAAGTDRITPTANNRLGSVFSSLYSFWLARQASIDRNAHLGGTRRDAYCLIFFNHEPSTCIENDFTSSPDELLAAALRYVASGNTNFTLALKRAQNIMDSHWSTERY
jgi:hypothetical protein